MSSTGPESGTNNLNINNTQSLGRAGQSLRKSTLVYLAPRTGYAAKSCSAAFINLAGTKVWGMRTASPHENLQQAWVRQ